ncbi:uncharacterized protein LOC108683301 isoform X2 [Hyalella azteca]|uniref:Uncharacterized protein LOC108683301 isoform X1 n=1 Tax=Hyalella azteca TaxID=294128 RepID=A0A8B7PRH7_HYAAZ|nr:uncharacterized protein LOC108683301 isoform X1 [Hyalella azteca]XP_047738472.1 uncharacterized protein LOC108683301 isoform X2 [Hyalella azteca]XP_047738473.1 uncharacterized protein LOC108683301 isoform X2 [Hyalella azteca]
MPLWNMIFGLSSDSDSDSPNDSDNNNVPTLRSFNRPGPDGQMPPTDRRSNLEDSRTPPSARHARDIRRTLEDQTTSPEVGPSQSSSATDSSDAPNSAGTSGTDDSPERGIWRSRTGGYLLYDDYSRPVRETRSRPGAYMQDIVANTGDDEVPTSFVLCLAGIVSVVPLGMFLFKLVTSIKDIFSR